MAKRQKQQANELEQIEAFFSTENEHRNKFFFKLYKEAESQRLFESPLIPLQNIDRLITVCYTGRAKPLQTAKAVIKDIHFFDREQKMFIYHLLVEFLEKTVWTDKDGKEITLAKIKDLLDAEFMYLINPEAKNHQPAKNEFDFKEVKKHLETLPDTKAKIKYLIEIKTDYEQGKEPFAIEIYNEVSFDRLCDLEIKKLQSLLKLEQSTTLQTTTEKHKVNAAFSLSETLSKIDYIRIINALSELRCFKKENGTLPTKKEVMQAFGTLVNIDLSNYDKDLNKAFTSNVTVEKNLEIFEKLKTKTQEIYLKKLNK